MAININNIKSPPRANLNLTAKAGTNHVPPIRESLPSHNSFFQVQIETLEREFDGHVAGCQTTGGAGVLHTTSVVTAVNATTTANGVAATRAIGQVSYRISSNKTLSGLTAIGQAGGLGVQYTSIVLVMDTIQDILPAQTTSNPVAHPMAMSFNAGNGGILTNVQLRMNATDPTDGGMVYLLLVDDVGGTATTAGTPALTSGYALNGVQIASIPDSALTAAGDVVGEQQSSVISLDMSVPVSAGEHWLGLVVTGSANLVYSDTFVLPGQSIWVDTLHLREGDFGPDQAYQVQISSEEMTLVTPTLGCMASGEFGVFTLTNTTFKPLIYCVAEGGDIWLPVTAFA